MANPNSYRVSLNKITDNLLAELAKPSPCQGEGGDIGGEINWHAVKLIGQELLILSGEAINEQVKQRQGYIKSKYGEKE